MAGALSGAVGRAPGRPRPAPGPVREGAPWWRNTDENGHVATLDGTITSIDPPRLPEVSADWGSTAPGQPGTRAHLTWELEPDGDHTLLHFTNKLDAPTQDVRTAAGWHLHLDALATVLAGGEVDIAHPDDLFAPPPTGLHRAIRRTPGAGLGVPALSRVGEYPPELGVSVQVGAEQLRLGA